jgi:hypothetical protein
MNSSFSDVAIQSQRNSSFTQPYFDLLEMISDRFSEMNQMNIRIPKLRRQRQPWTDEETKLLLLGVKLIGKGRWSLIHQQMGFSKNRTPTDLKDKWRNLIDSKQNSKIPINFKELAEAINLEQEANEKPPEIYLTSNSDIPHVPFHQEENENTDDLSLFQFEPFYFQDDEW